MQQVTPTVTVGVTSTVPGTSASYSSLRMLRFANPSNSRNRVGCRNGDGVCRTPSRARGLLRRDGHSDLLCPWPNLQTCLDN